MKCLPACEFYRNFLFVFNTMFLILTIFIMSLSLAIISKNKKIDPRITSHCTFSFVLGCLLFAFCFFGYYAVIKRRIWMLRMFIFSASANSVIHLILAIMAFATAYNMDEKKTKIAIRELFKDFDDEQRKEYIDNVQLELNCCGLKGIRTWSKDEMPQTCCDSASPCDEKNAYPVGCLEMIVMQYKRLKTLLAISASITTVVACIVAIWSSLVAQIMLRQREAAYLSANISQTFSEGDEDYQERDF